MGMIAFLRENGRWVAGGFLLTLFSSFGQTFFIALSAGDIRAEYGLSHGGFGTLYMVATLASAMTLPQVGKLVDRWSVVHVAWLTIAFLSLACVGMAVSRSVAVLLVVIWMLRLFGQGMMSHIAITSMGKWFSAQRGRAVSVSAVGLNIGEACLPFGFVLLATAIGWRGAWIAAAAMLLLVALPAIHLLMRVERRPRSADSSTAEPSPGIDWTRARMVRDPQFYLLMSGVLAPPFIGTAVFFHQVYLVELRGWSIEAFAASFTLMAICVITCALATGVLVDRFSAVRLLPGFLVPLGAGCFILGLFEGQWAAFAFMGLLGVSYGIATTLLGALWPEIYGTAHLGSLRSLIVAMLVLSTAIGPGLTGWMIDRGIDLPQQMLAMGVWCLAGVAAMTYASRALIARRERMAIA